MTGVSSVCDFHVGKHINSPLKSTDLCCWDLVAVLVGQFSIKSIPNATHGAGILFSTSLGHSWVNVGKYSSTMEHQINVQLLMTGDPETK